jgi:hypothetical protein
VALLIALRWPFEARLLPQAISLAGIVICALLLFGETAWAGARQSPDNGDGAGAHMDLVTDYGALSQRQVLARALGFFLWIFAVLLGGYLFGLVPVLVVSTCAFLRLFARESWMTTLLASAGLFLFVWLLFDRVVHVAWPATLVGDFFPVLRERFPWF